MCVCLALRRSNRDSVTECLKELHWLPIVQRIDFKILTLTHKCISKTGPEYLQQLITFKQPKSIGLRSSKKTNLLLRPATRCKMFADRSFSVAAPTLWNALPDDLREMDLLTFKKALKTHLFRKAFKG